MKRIPLTQGKCAIVDDEDYTYLMQWKWSAVEMYSTWYVVRAVYPENRHIYMHRFILDAPQNRQVDHIDRDGLNNRRQNLRLCNSSQQRLNQRPRNNGCSKYIGVSWNDHGFGVRWKAQITRRGERIFLGSFNNELEAAEAYDIAAWKLPGSEFAQLNFPRKEI